MATQPERSTAQSDLQSAIDKLGLTITCVFVPWSQSRNKNEKDDRGNARRSLNWRVTLSRIVVEPKLFPRSTYDASREAPVMSQETRRDDSGAAITQERIIPILTTDYSEGIAHCPSYKPSMTVDEARAVVRQCETGNKGYMPGLGYASAGAQWIKPSTPDVIHSLVMDAAVLDASSFEEWAGEYGYDIDSRKAETTYRACLDIALKLRNGIGEQGLEALRNASQDY